MNELAYDLDISTVKRSSHIKLVVGLGNPGKKYEESRHNVGFIIIDSLEGGELPEESLVKKTKSVFMNESGKSVKKFVDYYKISPQDLLIVHDDIDLPLGEVRVQKDRSSAGHQGVQSVINTLGTQAFTRVRVGVGRSEIQKVENWVLEDFSKEEEKKKEKAIGKAKEAIVQWLSEKR